MDKQPLGKQQAELLRFVAENAPVSVGEVADTFGLARGLARTTVLTMMEKLREKGYLRREKDGAAFRYWTVEGGAETLHGLVAEFVDRTLGGSVSPMVAYLARAKHLTPGELTELKAMVAALEKTGGSDGERRERQMNAFLSEWLVVMFVAAISGGLMAAVIYLVFRFVNRGLAELRAWLWWMAGVKFLVGLFFSIPLRVSLPAWAASPVTVPTEAGNGNGLLASGVLPGAVSPRPDVITGHFSLPLILSQIAFLAWVAGILIYAAYFVRQAFAVRRVLRAAESLDETPLGSAVRRLSARMGLTRPPRLLLSDAVTAPLTTNPFRPVIILPAELTEILSDAEIEMTLAHELAHIRRGDLILAIPFALAQAAFWFFPPVWWCYRAWDAARESACDEMALRVTAAAPARYGELLMKVVEADHRRLSLPALGVTSSFHTLKARLSDLRDFSASRPLERPVTALLILLGAIIALPLRVIGGDGEKSLEKGNLVQNSGFERGAESPDRLVLRFVARRPPGSGRPRHGGETLRGRPASRFSKTAPTFAPVALLSQTLSPAAVRGETYPCPRLGESHERPQGHPRRLFPAGRR